MCIVGARRKFTHLMDCRTSVLFYFCPFSINNNNKPCTVAFSNSAMEYQNNIPNYLSQNSLLAPSSFLSQNITELREKFDPIRSNISAQLNFIANFVSDDIIDSLMPSDLGLELQSEVVVNAMASDERASHVTQETVQFVDEDAGQQQGEYYINNSIFEADQTPAVTLGEYLRRPVKIYTYSWSESETVGIKATITPWQSFFNNKYIASKLANYAFLRCDLKIKVLVNASPFYYGAFMINYQPLPNFSPDTIGAGASTKYFIPESQRPHIWVYPQNSSGGEMTLPFFWPKNWLSVQKNQDFLDIGELNLIDYTGLQSANGATGSGCTIQIFAWAENVELSGPSLGLSLQSEVGLISKPASAVAKFARSLSAVPVIGKFARASDIGATAIAKIAGLFGWTNMPVIQPCTSVRPAPFSQLATTEIGYPKERLTLDPKNELAVDPSIVGLPSVDELSLNYLLTKESYLTQFTWSTLTATDTILFTSLVTPELQDFEAVSGATLLQQPVMAWASYYFNNWRGDIIFRFKVICSQYHKGRLRISWDPAGTTTSNITNIANSSAAIQTVVLDIGKDSDVEFRVPYNQALPWLVMVQDRGISTGFSLSPSPTFTYNPNNHNGTLSTTVLTDLSAPIATSSIQVMVFVRGADNLEVANPGFSQRQLLSPAIDGFQIQGDNAPIESSTPLTTGKDSRVAPDRYLLNFGERVTSLRPLLHRMHFIFSIFEDTNGVYQSIIYHWLFRLPPTFGYDAYGIHQAKGLITTGTNFPFNWCSINPLGYYLPGFIGYRGSINYTLNRAGTETLTPTMHITRRVLNTGAKASVNNNISGTTSLDAPRSSFLGFPTGNAGFALTNQHTNAGLEVSFPFYSPYKFESTCAQSGTWASFNGQPLVDAFEVMYSDSIENSVGKQSNFYAGTGHDFNVLFFLNAPSYLIFNSVPNAAT